MSGVARLGRLRRRVRSLPRLVVFIGLLVWALAPAGTPSSIVGAAEAAPSETSVRVLLPAEAASFVNAAAEGLSTAQKVTVPDVEVDGSLDARRNFIEGQSDAVVTGAPFTLTELAVLQKTGTSIVSVPVQAVGLGVFGFVSPLKTFPDGCLDDDSCFGTDQNYTGPIRFSPDVLTKLFFEDSTNIWQEDEFISNIEAPSGRFFLAPLRGPRPLVRTDPDASNMYLELYMALTAAKTHAAARAAVAGTDPSAPVSETWPDSITPSRLGMDNVVSQVREGLDPASSEVSAGGTVTTGSVGLVNESFALNADRPASQQVPLFRVELRNAAGEWMQPTTESISAAIAAGQGLPNAGAAGTPVPGAYPITWVNYLVAPTTGLSAEKVNAIAAMIRWQVTSGQAPQPLAASGDGRLTPAMVAQALQLADVLVLSNCKTARGTVEFSANAGGSAPPGGFAGLGAVSWCRPKAALVGGTDTVLESPGDAPISDFSDAGALEQVDAPIATDEGAPPQVLGENETAPSGAGQPAAMPAAQWSMPFALPGQTMPPLDRAATLGLGALGYAAWRMRRRRQS
ncbi:MAG: hypothetical protein ACKOYM_05270 [Actinomycetes bacterium]